MPRDAALSAPGRFVEHVGRHSVLGKELARARRGRPLLVLLESHVVVFDGLREVASLVLAGTSRVRSVNVVGIDFKHSGKVVDALLKVAELLKRTPSNVVCACVVWVEAHECVRVVYCFFEESLLEERGGADEECLLVRRVLLDFL